ncbi:MAG: hypothetical protein KDA21_06080, partial [Phycisphaerales bacterium]|nr:hypothetical protein [Phycisphaerales bacterium]
MTSTPAQTGSQRFDEELDHAFQAVRGALTQMLSSVQADPDRPQDIARRFRINKNLAWKLSKIVTVTDPHTIIANIPGVTGMNTILGAFESGGAPAATVDAARSALVDFDRVIEVHVGDRSTLQLVLSSNAPHKVPQEQLHATRKMAYQGNSAIWGIQARVRFASFFLAPNRDHPSLLDTASLGGLVDVRRLRADVGTPLFMRFSYNDDGTIRTGPEPEPIEPGNGQPNPMLLMREFCSTPIPDFRALRDGSYTRFQLAPGPIGNRGRHTWVYGECTRAFASRFRDENNTVGEHVAPVQIAAEWLLADLQVHRDLKFA